MDRLKEIKKKCKADSRACSSFIFMDKKDFASNAPAVPSNASEFKNLLWRLGYFDYLKKDAAPE